MKEIDMNELEGINETSSAMSAKFLGVSLGTCTGWDGDLECLMFYDFVSNIPGIPDASCIGIHIDTGRFLTYNDDGDECDIGSVLELLAGH